MITIRAQQLDTLRLQRERRFSSGLFAFLRGLHTFRRCSDEELLRRMDAAIARAQGYGLTAERSIATFVGWMLLFGSRFDSYPRIQQLLTLPTVPPDERVDVVKRLIKDAEWITLRAQSDDALGL